MSQISEELFKRAELVIPGGVNSPVRAFRSVGRTPIFIDKAKGASVWDADGNRYTDYICSWGPLILGHACEAVVEAVAKAAEKGTSYGLPTESEVEMAELVCSLVPGVEMVRMVSSGTEAVLSALRLARGFTGRELIVKFEGCYHGHADSMLVKAGSGLATAGQPDSAGVTKAVAADTLTCAYNDAEGLKKIFELHGSDIAAVIVEPVGANMGVVPPEAGFLQSLREITKKYGALLIFDEVITGFRLGIHCASGFYGVTPDLSTFGKIIGGGLPVGAYGGRREIMEQVAPLGPVYQAGTLSGNPIAMAAGLATLKILQSQPEIYKRLEKLGAQFRQGAAEIFAKAGIPASVQGLSSIGTVFFTKGGVKNYDDARKCDTKRFARYFNGLLERGVLIAPSQFEAMFFSAAHSQADVEYFLDSLNAVVAQKDF
jgi:glutamate-1-semialdehyde 2,1-aminomutase